MSDSFPLKWPDGRSVTDWFKRKDANFKTTLGKARDELLHELDLMNAKNVIISSNISTYKSKGKDLMYADESTAKDAPGVAVYFTWKENEYALCCDVWKTVTQNIQALNKTVNAIRGIERWGTGEMMKAAFSGFKSLPDSPKPKTPWEILGIQQGSGLNIIKAAYYAKVKVLHPDKGGTTAAFQELQKAYKQLS